MNTKNLLAALWLLLAAFSAPAFSAVSLTSPNNNALYLAPAAAIPVRANASIGGGLTVVRVEFYANGNLINTDTTSPYQFDWTNVAAGTYTITAKMVDSGGGETTSAPRTITVADTNTPPTVSLTAPANNAAYISPASVTASATASGPELNDLLQRVEFYLNGNLAATVTQAPYTTSLSGLADGSYSLTAVAVDGQGAQTTSAARTFTIGANQPPTVSIITPLDNSKWHSPAGFLFQVNAAAPEVNDTLTVEFYANGNLIGTRTSSPWSINTSNLTAGTYVLTAKAIDGQGLNTTSAARTIEVSDTNIAPTVSITAPTANANFPAPAASITVNATANAGEVNGWITRVEFYVNGVLTNTDTAGPFSFSMTNVPAGSYTLTAKAVDQLNAETMSAPINITVGAATMYFIHTDHLNTPRVITNTASQVVWRWDHTEPFGSDPANGNPSGLGTFEFNLRLPGQYFDKESNLHYNYFRDYDSGRGQFLQSDPIGLGGGVNTYGYVGGNPVSNFDPLGLYCTSANGTTTCSYPGGPAFSVPTPQGFPSKLGLSPLYHRYQVNRSIGCVSARDALQALVSKPAPGNANPATPSGTPNNALIFGSDNNVTSYLTSDLNTGAPVVVNITGPGSFLPSGYVARTVSNGMINTYGEGNNWLQSPLLAFLQGGPSFGPMAVMLQQLGTDLFWKAQSNQVLNQCTCGR